MKHLLLIGILISSTSVWSKADVIFSIKEIQNIIGDYPAYGTPAETADFNELHRLQDTRTAEECAQAATEDNVSLQVLFAGARGPLKPNDLKKVSKITLLAYNAAFVNIATAKNYYKRPRPYLTDTTLNPCAPREKSMAYPSGHATLSRAYAHMLAEYFPEKREALMERANEVAFHRVLGGVHHPTDIEAGKKLGDAIAKAVAELQ